MKRFLTYFLLLSPLVLTSEVFAQDCGKNMLSIPNTSSYAVIQNPKSISLPGAFTIEFWAQSSSFSAHSGIVEQVNKGDTGAFSIGFSSGDSIAVSLRLNNGIVNITTSNITNIQSWNHFAVSFTPNDSIRIYVNGSLKISQKTKAAKLIVSADSVLIGHSNLSGVTFIGNIDELRFWSSARTSAEILSSWKTVLTGKESGLKAYYSFDDDTTVHTIHDFSGGGSEGNLVSSAVLTISTSPVTGTTASYMLASKELKIIFPDLVCSTSADTNIHIFNRGSEQVVIDPVSFASGTIFSATTTGFPLPPDSTHIGIINIHASPIKPGFYRDVLLVPSTTVCGGILRIPVELRVQKVSVAFQDSIFKLGNLLPCDLPLNLPGQTTLYNIGTKAVIINSLQFSVTSGIKIISPIAPFTIDSGKSIPIIFTVLPGTPGPINTTLIANTKECSFSTKIVFQGNRIITQFTIPNIIQFSTIHLPPSSITIDTTIFLKNTGTSVLSMNPALSLLGGSGFRLLSPQSGLASVKPDSSLAIKIQFKTSDCGTFETALHFQDQINCSIDTLIPISITVLGPDVSGGSSTFDLGASCGTHDTTITLVNKSGREVILGKPVFAKDNIFSLINAVFPRSLFPNDSVSLTIHFAPSEPGSYIVHARFPLSPCGEADLTLQGLLGIGQIALSDSSLDFGNGCDFTPGLKKLTITNQTGKEITVTESKIEGSQNFSIIDPSLPFKMTSNQSQEISVRFMPKQLGTLEQGRINLYDSGCFVTRFAVHGVRERANIPPILSEFGTICPGKASTISAILQNFGYGDDTVISNHFIGAASFNVSNIIGDVIKHGSVLPISITFSPKDTGQVLGLLEILLAPCGDTVRIALHGIGGPAAVLSISDSILDFKTIKLGTTDSLCTILTNPSCNRLLVSTDSLHSTHSVFSLSQNSRSNLPDSIIIAAPVTLCFVFSPDSIGSFEATDTIRIGGQKKIVTLRGTAGISDLSFNPRIFDFGYILKGSSDTLRLAIHNKGTYPASPVIINTIAPDFIILPPAQTIGGLAFDTDKVIFSPSILGLQTSIIVFSWDNHIDTIFLRGKGIQPGLQISSSLLDFSKVRTAHDSVITITVTNNLASDVIVIDSVSITGKFTVLPNTKATVNLGEKLFYSITYFPDAEIVDTGTLTFHTENSINTALPLHGEGVEAHLVVSTTGINFGNVGIGQTQKYHLKISDTGSYPLSITGLNHSVPNYSTTPSGAFTIPPKSSIEEIVVSFMPLRAITYTDTLRIDADAPEKVTLISLQGKGVFAPLGIPQVSYSIPDRQAKVGELIEVPISISGTDLALFNLDSFRVEIAYDPHIVFFHDTITTLGTLSSGFKMKFERLAHDSVIRITGAGNSIIPFASRLFILHAEGLLGPVDSTRIFVSSSDPQNTENIFSSSGLFLVTDCGNYRGGIASKGNYSVSNITPNPASSTAHIDYEIGLTGRVHLNIFDPLGRHIRTIIDDNQTKGKHTARFSTDGIPSGEYIYVLKSLEYENRGTMIILN